MDCIKQLNVISTESRLPAVLAHKSLILKCFFLSLSAYRRCSTNEHPSAFRWVRRNKETWTSTAHSNSKIPYLLSHTLQSCLWSYHYISLSLHTYTLYSKPPPAKILPVHMHLLIVLISDFPCDYGNTRQLVACGSSDTIFSCVCSCQSLSALWCNVDRSEVTFWSHPVYLLKKMYLCLAVTYLL